MVQFLCSSHLLPEESHPSCFSCMPQAAEAYCLTCSVQAHGSWSLNRRPHFLPFSREWGHHAQRPSNRSGNYSAAKTAVLDLFPSPHCWLLVCCGNGNISVMFFFFFFSPCRHLCFLRVCARGAWPYIPAWTVTPLPIPPYLLPVVSSPSSTPPKFRSPRLLFSSPTLCAFPLYRTYVGTIGGLPSFTPALFVFVNTRD